MMIGLKNVLSCSLIIFSTLIFNIPVYVVVTLVVSVVNNVDITLLYIDNDLVVVPEINTKLCIQFYILLKLIVIY